MAFKIISRMCLVLYSEDIIKEWFAWALGPKIVTFDRSRLRLADAIQRTYHTVRPEVYLANNPQHCLSSTYNERPGFERGRTRYHTEAVMGSTASVLIACSEGTRYNKESRQHNLVDMAVKIVTDSTSDLRPEIASPLGITVVPLFIHFGTESYRDGIDLTTEEFYQRLATSKTLPTTAVPGPAAVAQVYDELARETDEIVVISLASKLSSIHQMELQAVGLMRKKCRIEIIDSKAGCMALGLIAIAAAKAAKAGAKIEDVLNLTRRNIYRSKIYFAFDTLEYLKRSGRVSAAQAFLGSMLKVNPIMTLEDGEGRPVARPRSRARAIEFLYKFAASFSNIEEMAIEDGTTPDEADMLAERISSRFPKERIYRTKVSPVVGTHVGPHVLAVSVLGDTG